MPTLNLFTNIPVDSVIASDILKDATKVVAKIIGKPESVCPFTLSCQFYFYYLHILTYKLLGTNVSNRCLIGFLCKILDVLFHIKFVCLLARVSAYVMLLQYA